MKGYILLFAVVEFLWIPNVIASDSVGTTAAIDGFDVDAWVKELEDRMDQKHVDAMAALDRQHAQAVRQRKERISSLKQTRAELAQQLVDHESTPAITSQDHRQLANKRIDLLKRLLADKMKCLNVLKSNSKELYLEGCNVHVRNGMKNSFGLNGLGNVIIGYNEQTNCQSPDVDCDRDGSHNLVVGRFHQYASAGSLIGGESNGVFGTTSSITGGANNVIHAGDGVTIAGGNYNYVSCDWGSTILGGSDHQMFGDVSTIIGGYMNRIYTPLGTSVGGVTNLIDYESAAILGGVRNQALAYDSAICGGAYGVTLGTSSAILGGNFSYTTSYLESVPEW